MASAASGRQSNPRRAFRELRPYGTCPTGREPQARYKDQARGQPREQQFQCRTLLILTPQCRWIERRAAPVKSGHISDKIHAPPADSAGIPIEADQPYDVQALPWLQSMRSMSAAKSLYSSPRLWVAERIAAVASRCWSSGSAAISALIESRCRRTS